MEHIDEVKWKRDILQLISHVAYWSLKNNTSHEGKFDEIYIKKNLDELWDNILLDKIINKIITKWRFGVIIKSYLFIFWEIWHLR